MRRLRMTMGVSTMDLLIPGTRHPNQGGLSGARRDRDLNERRSSERIEGSQSRPRSDRQNGSAACDEARKQPTSPSEEVLDRSCRLSTGMIASADVHVERAR